MFSRSAFVAVFVSLLCAVAAVSQPRDIRTILIGSAYTEPVAYDAMRTMFDQAGGRLVGTPQNRKAMEILERELRRIGYEPKYDTYTIPGFLRGDDEVKMLSPIDRKLRAVALGYVNAHDPLDAEAVFVGHGYDEDYEKIGARGKIAVVTQSAPRGKSPLLRYEVIDIAATKGVRAVLFINESRGGLVLAGVSNFQGRPSAIPAYSVTFEEGNWLRRLSEAGTPARVRITTRSRVETVETANLIATLPGKSSKKIIVGAHFDSWDLGQGAIDNGQGTALLLEIARLLRRHVTDNYYTIEFVWFNGEELGLWGAKHHAEKTDPNQVFCMVNMDMTGRPTGFNAGGFDEFIPLLAKTAASLKGYDISTEVANSVWTNSDQQAFYLKGIPSLTIMGHLDPEQTRHYHDFGDTFDAMNRRFLSDGAAVISVLVYDLSVADTLSTKPRTEKETIELLTKSKVDEGLRRQGEWPFKK